MSVTDVARSLENEYREKVAMAHVRHRRRSLFGEYYREYIYAIFGHLLDKPFFFSKGAPNGPFEGSRA